MRSLTRSKSEAFYISVWIFSFVCAYISHHFLGWPGIAAYTLASINSEFEVWRREVMK